MRCVEYQLAACLTVWVCSCIVVPVEYVFSQHCDESASQSPVDCLWICDMCVSFRRCVLRLEPNVAVADWKAHMSNFYASVEDFNTSIKKHTQTRARISVIRKSYVEFSTLLFACKCVCVYFTYFHFKSTTVHRKCENSEFLWMAICSLLWHCNEILRNPKYE